MMGIGNRALSIEGLSIVRRSEDIAFSLNVPQFRLPRGARVALVGPSGSGKSTLLDFLALLLKPQNIDSFKLAVPGRSATDISPLLRHWRGDALADIRRYAVGYVPQTGGLLSFLSVERNVALAAQLAGGVERERAERIIRDVGLERHRRKPPAALSVGERQRVAIARALVHEPLIVIADEPTSALDPQTADRVLSLLVREADRRNATLIVATHDVERIGRFDFSFAQHRLEAGHDSRHVISTFNLNM
jgi:putative ABC transport system ATP-binding protein